MPIPGNVTISNIPGGSEKEGREGTCDFFALTHPITANIDPSTGTMSGRRLHSPVRALIRVDKATPLLFKALADNQRLDEVKFDFYRINPSSRAEEKYFTVTLANARVETASLVKPDTLTQSNERKQDMLEVSFIYEEITWEFLPDSIVATDRWAAPSESAGSGGDD